MSDEVGIRPNPGPQEAFCRSSAFEVLYGGQAGGGKSYALLIEAARYVHVKGYRAIIFRRVFPSLERSIIAKAHEVYPAIGGRYQDRYHRWRFPSGAVIELGHLEHEQSVHAYQSAEYAFMGFDELTEFSEGQYRYMISSRGRTTARDADGSPLPVVIRACTNPGGIGHDWVRRRWGAWLGADVTAQSGDVRYYAEVNGESREVPRETPRALGRQFIRARLEDNPQLMTTDPGYGDRLSALPLLVRAALRDGRWDLAADGNVFRREWLSHVIEAGALPPDLRWVRYYDLALSLKTTASRTATISAALGPDGTLYLRDGYADRIEWPEQEMMIRRYLHAEPETEHGIEDKMHGLAALQSITRDPVFVRTRIVPVSPIGDKLSRALAWSARAERGKLVLVEGEWIPEFVSEAVAFDGTDRTWNDRVDAVSGCVQMLGAAPIRAASGFPSPYQPPRGVRPGRLGGRIFR